MKQIVLLFLFFFQELIGVSEPLSGTKHIWEYIMFSVFLGMYRKSFRTLFRLVCQELK